MIVVTDGESHDGEELPEALEECEKRNVTRYAIAVSALATVLPGAGAVPQFPHSPFAPCRGRAPPSRLRWGRDPAPGRRCVPSPQVLGHYLRRQQDPEDFIREIKYIASDPDEKYFFNVSDEAALNDIVDALGDRIFSLEGDAGPDADPQPRGRSGRRPIWRNPVSFPLPRNPRGQRELLRAGDVPGRLLRPPPGGEAAGPGRMRPLGLGLELCRSGK